MSSDRGSILEPIEMESTGSKQIVAFETDELTAICPFEFGGPDFYNLTIRYCFVRGMPDKEYLGVESKSLKKYIESWRDAEISAEDLATQIRDDIRRVVTADLVYVHLEQARRGGIEETVEVGDDPYEL